MTREEVQNMADMRETYTLMFTDYPDIVNLDQMRKMLGGINNTLAYRMLREKKIKSFMEILIAMIIRIIFV